MTELESKVKELFEQLDGEAARVLASQKEKTNA